MQRWIVLGLATGAAALGITGCTTNTQLCKNGTCEIDLSGQGAHDTLGGAGGSVVELVSASGNTARLKVAGAPLALTVGQPVTLDNGTLLLERVEGKDDVQLRVTGGSPTSPAPTTPAPGTVPGTTS